LGLSLSEQATLNFYEWEYLGRGYYHFDSVVDIEPPYRPFYFKPSSSENYVDDGKFNLISTISKLLKGKEEETEIEEVAFVPNPLRSLGKLKGFSLSFGRDQEISSIISLEFLNMLSYSDDVLSFEILANVETIRVQITCSSLDESRIKSHLKAYFPNVRIKDVDVYELFDIHRDLAIGDFGFQDEYMRPISTVQSFALDPLTSIIASMENLQENETALFQTIFKGVTAPWAQDISYSVSDGSGGSFFADSPEMVSLAQEKVSSPLFSVIMRIATQGINNERSRYLASELSRSISTVSNSPFNKLIPLSNEGYDYEQHLRNVFERRSNRLGMIMNGNELVSFVHYPNKSIISQKLRPQTGKTKLLPQICLNKKYVLGMNHHEREEQEVSISDDVYSKHMVIAGSTGSGKTHLLKQLIYQDLEHENATFIIDPHGDLAEDILLNVQKKDKERVVYVNVADNDYSFGFNIFTTKTDAEKITLASDLVSAFSDSWISSGDRIQSVLQKTISTFLYSQKEASILDMKRFLLERDFRNEFLESLDDPILNYYWQNEFPLVRRNELSPLLLRIDNFMQTRLLRNMFAQRSGIDFNELVKQQKLVIIQLSVGLIGLENSKFIAKLLIAKINQIAFARQSISHTQRKPIHFYIDEAHIYANSPAIEQLLSGARKYSLSLVLVLQHLEQVQTQILNSILTNTATQIFFRQSEKDSRRIASGFSFFEIDDFMELDLGEALVKINKRSNDFNLKTLPLKLFVSEIEAKIIKSYIIQRSQKTYALDSDEVNEIIRSFVPKTHKAEQKKEEANIKLKPKEKKKKVEQGQFPIIEIPKEKKEEKTDLEKQKQNYIKQTEKQENLRKHRSIQNFVKTLALQHGFKAVLEEETKNGGRVDVGLTKEDIRIAIEVSVTNTAEYEVKNIQKCIDERYNLVFMISENEKHLKKIKVLTKKIIDKKVQNKIFFLLPKQFGPSLYSISIFDKKSHKRVNGWRVKVNYHPDDPNSQYLSSLRNKIVKELGK